MSGPQRRMYQTIQTFKGLEYNKQGKLKRFSNILMQLKKCCNHPYLFRYDLYDITEDLVRISGKMCFLDNVLLKLKRTNHRTLIFTQMTQLLDLLEEYFRLRQTQYLRLDGSVSADERDHRLELFTQEGSEYEIFIISTRAGGLGLNLQVADTVIIFDSDWNPQQDLQAQARVHRLGQTKDVKVFRLITSMSVEEAIQE
eukprot:UN31872